MTAAPERRPRAPVDAASPVLDMLYESEFENIWGLLQRLGVSDSNIEDGVQEVFVAAHARLSTFDAMRPIRPWLFGITVRVASEMRRRARRAMPPREGIEALVSESSSGPEQQVIARALVTAALDQLDFDQRAVLVMHDVEGFAAPEIAQALVTPLNTVYSRLRLARAKVTALLRG